MGRKIARGEAAVVLSAEEAAKEFRLELDDAVALVGSGIRVPASWIAEYRTRTGSLDFTMDDCSVLTGIPPKTLNVWRVKGLLNVRALSPTLKSRILVCPAELVRILRIIAKNRNGAVTVHETPSQAARRSAAERDAALAACDGE